MENSPAEDSFERRVQKLRIWRHEQTARHTSWAAAGAALAALLALKGAIETSALMSGSLLFAMPALLGVMSVGFVVYSIWELYQALRGRKELV